MSISPGAMNLGSTWRSKAKTSTAYQEAIHTSQVRCVRHSLCLQVISLFNQLVYCTKFTLVSSFIAATTTMYCDHNCTHNHYFRTRFSGVAGLPANPCSHPWAANGSVAAVSCWEAAIRRQTAAGGGCDDRTNGAAGGAHSSRCSLNPGL